MIDQTDQTFVLWLIIVWIRTTAQYVENKEKQFDIEPNFILDDYVNNK